MKTPRFFPVSISVFLHILLLSFAGLFSASADETAVWLAKDARLAQGKIVLPDSKGAMDFELADASGVKIGGAPGKIGDTKSIEFSGAQTSMFKTVVPLPPMETSLKLSLQVRPAESAGEEDGTLLRYGTQWEIRYFTKKSAFQLIVWNEEGKFTIVTVPAKQGSWQTLNASVTANSMALSVDGEDAVGEPSGPFRIEPKPLSLSMGGVAGKEMGRPFFGSVADIRISIE